MKNNELNVLDLFETFARQFIFLAVIYVLVSAGVAGIGLNLVTVILIS